MRKVKITVKMLAWLMIMSSAAAAPDGAKAGRDAPASSPPPAADEAARERRVWRGAPIPVELKLGRERIIRIPDAGQLRAGTIGGPVPGLRIQPLGNRLFLLATQPFAAIRMLVQDEAGRQVVLDLTAADEIAAGPPIDILVSSPPPVPETADAGGSAAPPAPPVTSYVALIRHGAQTLYAPPRLIPRSDRIVPVPLPVQGLIPLVRGGVVSATPIAAWRALGPGGPLWLTAVRLQNQTATPVVLDPRMLRGRWRAAGFQHARLLPAGDPADTTAAYLISSQPFDEALAPWGGAGVR